MKGDKLGIAVRKAVSQLTKNGGQTDGGVSQNIFSKGILLALGGVMGYILRASMNNIEQELWFFSLLSLSFLLPAYKKLMS